RARGVTADDVVSFQLPNCAEAVIVFQAVMKLGATANPIVPIYRGRELRFILGQSRAKVVFIPDTLRGVDYCSMYADLATELPDLELVVTIGDDSSSAPVTAWDTLMSSVTAPMISAVVSLNEP